VKVAKNKNSKKKATPQAKPVQAQKAASKNNKNKKKK
jgi:hypothetical protein